MSVEFGRSIRPRWLLDPDVVFLNNGSFGATPIEVLQVQRQWQERFEREPVEFVGRHLHRELRAAAEVMAQFLGARGEDVVFVENATTGVNAVLRSLVPLLQPGDQVLTTSHVYNAVRQAMRYIAALARAEYVEVPVPFPIASGDQVVEAVRAALTERTRFALFDHVTSPTGIVFPVEKLIMLCKERGILVMIDGAHAPGMIPLTLSALGADWYTGNFHKWLFAPKGCAFLWTAPEYQTITHPVVISHGYGSGYIAEFDFTGTKDWSAYLSAPAGLEFFHQLGAERVYQYNRSLALYAQRVLAEAVGCPLPAPPEMIAYLAAVPLSPSHVRGWSAQQIHDWLFDERRIEVPVFTFGSDLLLRTASQVYNEPQEYQYLASVLCEWIARAD
ncbi:MAG: aminotransferase class V-fold PLP-dependent enzyme [Bacteroidota bacterium]|nr:aminotransferase class V-fold PLP-dependent enzyme [Candidatus Kapabacteria bacterium]MCS7302956.1 aminotransferase class V-fold PLP-dependent enzyme [Candidatus Kapabacteria bacterium]MCX7937495.1 aminotransferase class V-fold PLP-dependent enzyme [Chlorobiota bacterium]MDW8075836.1 aminotransferase class V-fold PLP-dependent enzyme [Bacteroidota bacterium]MDW8271704.1 aminotransferase class V-fold PLP-dependent enzyme [Bacteroidota bacterium]